METRWPQEEERQVDPRWTERVARPTPSTWPYRMPSIQEAQQIWDTAERARLDHVTALEGLAADRAKKESAQIADFEAKRMQWANNEDEKLVGEFKRRFFSADPTATEEAFTEALPEIRRQYRIDAALGRTNVETNKSPFNRPIAG